LHGFLLAFSLDPLFFRLVNWSFAWFLPYIYVLVPVFRQKGSVLSVSFLVGGRWARGFCFRSFICGRSSCRWFHIFIFSAGVWLVCSFFFMGAGWSMGCGLFFAGAGGFFWGIYSIPLLLYAISHSLLSVPISTFRT